VLQLGISPVAFGIIDGLYQGVAALVRIAGGLLGDRWRRYKELAAVGYGVSAACRLLILAAGASWTTIAAVVSIDRIGKGLRTAPRDAMISLRSRSEDLATAFGVHRSLDAVGAFIGPIVAFLLLARMQGAFDVLFIVSFAVAVLGLGVILIFVEPVRAESHASSATVPGMREMLGVLRLPRFRAITILALILGIPTISDSFIFLSLQTTLQTGATAFPLFYVGTSICTAMFSVPGGRAADILGRGKVLLAGYVLLGLAYLSVMMTGGVAAVVLTLLLMGGYYAATDGVLTAMAAAELPTTAAGGGLAMLATVTNVARLAASVIFGLLWSTIGMQGATRIYLAGLTLAIIGGIFVVAGSLHGSRPPDAVDTAR
jgi:MFS family permease